MAPPWVKGPREGPISAANQIFRAPIVMPKSPGTPQSLGSLLQQAPLRAPSPSMNENSEVCPSTSPSTDRGNQGTAKHALKGLITPQSGGPLTGAKMVLPPFPVGSMRKVVSGKTPDQLSKIAKLRQSVHPPLEDMGSLLKEIEEGIKLNHVSCDDRSKPLIRRCQTFFPDF